MLFLGIFECHLVENYHIEEDFFEVDENQFFVVNLATRFIFQVGKPEHQVVDSPGA